MFGILGQLCTASLGMCVQICTAMLGTSGQFHTAIFGMFGQLCTALVVFLGGFVRYSAELCTSSVQLLAGFRQLYAHCVVMDDLTALCVGCCQTSGFCTSTRGPSDSVQNMDPCDYFHVPGPNCLICVHGQSGSLATESLRNPLGDFINLAEVRLDQTRQDFPFLDQTRSDKTRPVRRLCRSVSALPSLPNTMSDDYAL